MLTQDELKELNYVAMVGMDILRTSESVPPCWLTMSEESKADARKKAVAWLNEQMRTIVPLNEQQAEEKISRMGMQPLLQKWRQAEDDAKQRREAGDPRAFFA